MNKYTKLSDFEINRRIAEIDTKNRYVYFEKEQTIFRKFNNGQTQKFNPCNYPSDAWQLILEAKLSINPDFNNDCESWIIRNIHIPMVSETNLSRGISIAYLLMKDKENSNGN
ncbi:phage protein NinX family protein [Providencia rettgeri]|uniref:phage protein NinX family protein n=1 Tax=Providencia TaxID=586 RepID=UPI0021D4BC66|nr:MULTISPECIES: phage protein NinX family protein [Providencia]WIE09302.1 DUF2591 family protein [Providencia rettgeri]